MLRPQEEGELLRGPEGQTVYLLDSASALETKLLTSWVRRSGDGNVVRINPSRRRRIEVEDNLSAVLEREDDPYLIPLRVVWMAPEKNGRRSVGWSDAFRPGDPRDPYWLRAKLIRTFRPGRVRLIAASGAHVEEMRLAFEKSNEIDGLARFVTRRAWRTLDRGERRVRGNRYKIPRFVPEAILSRGEFASAVDRWADEAGTERDQAHKDAERYLNEIAATHSPYVIDLIANAIHALYTQGYGSIQYPPEDVSRIAELSADHPIVFLPSHRSNLDRLSLQFMLWENDLPPNHTAGGINLNFFPIGPLLRRTGVFFIRRTFRDNELYKIVLRSYLDYLVEKRFPLEWYMEGGRSRSGRLNPARFGMLHYVVDAHRRGKSDDIFLIPVSIAYDQIQDVPDYAREAEGRSKESESIGWLVKAVRSLRQRYGDIYIRFGEPVSVASVVGTIPEDAEDSIGLRKLAFEVMYRIGRATPFTPVSVVSIALLAARGKAKTAEELAEDCARIRRFITSRHLELTESVDLTDPSQVTAVLAELANHGNVSSHEALGRTVYWLDDTQMIRISYYRNVVVHFFMNRAIAEMALAAALEEGKRDTEFVTEKMLEIRDVLKFEFYFPEKSEFLKEVTSELSVDAPEWETDLTARGPLSVLAQLGNPVAYWAVLPFLDAYRIVGDELEDVSGSFDEKRFLKACLDRARMYRIEDRLFTGESASQVLFKSALRLADNRSLLEDGEDIATARSQFADEIRKLRQLAAIGITDS